MSKLTITANHPVRAAVASIPDYHDCLANAVYDIRQALGDHDLRMDDPVFNGDEGYTTCIIRPGEGSLFCCECCAESNDRKEFGNVVHISYYKVREGRWEVIKYVS